MNSNDEERTEREFLVATDGAAIPMYDMPPPSLLGMFAKKQKITFASEARRIIRVESAQLQKRILDPLRKMRSLVKPLGYQRNFYAAVPTLGPLAIGMMTMTTQSGLSYFFAVRTVARIGGKVIDKGFIGFGSFLADDDSVLTLSPARLPKPREGVDRAILKVENPEWILREHRKRMREYDVLPIEASDLVELIRRQNILDCNEYLEQGLLRPANSGEVSWIRAQKGN